MTTVLSILAIFISLSTPFVGVWLRKMNKAKDERIHAEYESREIGRFPLDALSKGLDFRDFGPWCTEEEVLALMVRHFQVSIDDWGPQFSDDRYRWTVFDVRSDRVQFLNPLTDWSEVVGVGLPYILGNAPTPEQAHAEAVEWMAKHPHLTVREDLE